MVSRSPGDGGMSCSLCGADDSGGFRRWFAGEVNLYRCRRCGFVFQYPFRIEWTARESGDDLDFLERGQRFKYPRRHRVLANIRDVCRSFSPGGRLLDIGCGDGHFLSLCAEAGYECHGVEPRSELADYAAGVSGAEVRDSVYAEELFPAGAMDVVSMIQVLEHMEHPKVVLGAARRHLREGGYVVIEVPSITAPHFLAYRMTGLRWFVRPPTGVIRPHVGYYSPGTLRALAERCGFRTMRLVTGRWRFKYGGMLGRSGHVLDPLLNVLRVGGILYVGRKVSDRT